MGRCSNTGRRPRVVGIFTSVVRLAHTHVYHDDAVGHLRIYIIVYIAQKEEYLVTTRREGGGCDRTEQCIHNPFGNTPLIGHLPSTNVIIIYDEHVIREPESLPKVISRTVTRALVDSKIYAVGKTAYFRGSNYFAKR